jgi:hypothetical protein
VDCLRRGLASLAANWELVPLCWLQSAAVFALCALGLLLPLVALGLDLLLALFSGAGDADSLLASLQSRLSGATALGLFVAAVLGMLVAWTLALFVYCYFQAGAFGVLTAADRQAPPGDAGDRRPFRAFSTASFQAWARRRLWRFFWLVNLFWTAVGLVALAGVLWLVLALAGADRWGWWPALGLGCSGLLPLGLACLVLALWYHLAQADLARQGSGVRRASRRGFAVLVRRPGAVALLALIFAATAIALSLAFAVAGAVFDFALNDAPFLRLALNLALPLLQGLPSAALAVALGGTLVALVRSEMPDVEPAAAEVAA